MKKSTKLNKNKTIFVGLSGGVDSSVAAYLLKSAKPNNFKKLFGCPAPKGFNGYNVVGAFIKIWQPEFADTCTWKDDRRSAMRVAAHLNIPFVTIDLSDEYKRGVIDYMISEYKSGRTPNPDVMCNKEIKFKAFLNKSLEMGADMIATGHYAQISQKSKVKSQKDNSKLKSENTDSLSTTSYQLLTAHDSAKEQSYFLWTLGQNELSKTLLPIGHLAKKEVRKIAEKAGLHTFEKKDSQGLCFIGHVDFKDFLKQYIAPKKGDVLNTEGQVIGHHDGAMFLTIGERHGFTITRKTTNDEVLYVVEKDVEANTVTVSTKTKLEETIKTKTDFEITETNWISKIPEQGEKYKAQVRYHQNYQNCTIKITGDKTANIIFDSPQLGARGQSIVVYDKDVCMGGGVII